MHLQGEFHEKSMNGASIQTITIQLTDEEKNCLLSFCVRIRSIERALTSSYRAETIRMHRYSSI